MVEQGARVSGLERLRIAPGRVSGPELVRALNRVSELAGLGTGRVDVAGVPANRLAALARYGLTAKAPALRQLTGPRRVATLLAAVRQLETAAVDDALDLLDVLMTSKLLARPERESEAERVRMLPRFARASTKLARVVRIFEQAAAEGVSLTEAWARSDQVVPREELTVAIAVVNELAPPGEEDADAPWRAELVCRYATVRPFLPMLCEAIEFGAAEGGQEILAAARRLPELLGRKKVRAGEITSSIVVGSWKRLVFGNQEVEAGVVDHRAYAFCVLEQLHRALHSALHNPNTPRPATLLVNGPVIQLPGHHAKVWRDGYRKN